MQSPGLKIPERAGSGAELLALPFWAITGVTISVAAVIENVWPWVGIEIVGDMFCKLTSSVKNVSNPFITALNSKVKTIVSGE